MVSHEAGGSPRELVVDCKSGGDPGNDTDGGGEVGRLEAMAWSRMNCMSCILCFDMSVNPSLSISVSSSWDRRKSVLIDSKRDCVCSCIVVIRRAMALIEACSWRMAGSLLGMDAETVIGMSNLGGCSEVGDRD